MRLGFLTACMPDRSLEEIAAWAAEHRFEALEVAAWPDLGDRPFTATHIDVADLDQAGADGIRELFDRHGLTLSSLAFYDNNLHPDPTERKAVNDHVLACIDAAALLGCPTVGTFVGRDPTRPVADNLRQAEQVFAPLVDRAGERGVKLIIENCVMEGWHPDGYPGNLAYSPGAVGVDVLPRPVPELRPLAPGLDGDRPGDRAAALCRPDPPRPGQGHPAVRGPPQPVRLAGPGGGAARPLGRRLVALPGARPGPGRLARVVDTLYEGGFDGVLSVEHEDPVWGGTEDKVKTGLDIAHHTLRPLLVA